VPLGDIGPGAEGEVTFFGVVDLNKSAEPWAAVAVEIHDAAHPIGGPPLEWLWAHHQVDRVGPQFFGIQQPRYLLGAGANDLCGYAYDDAGVPLVSLEIQGPSGPSALVCPDDQPADGRWSCTWGVTGNHGDVLNVRLAATDGFGQVSAWDTPLPFLVDTMPPAVTLDFTATQVFSGSLVARSDFSLYGDVADDGGLGHVDVCITDDVAGGLQNACGPAWLRLIPGATAVTYDDAPDTPVAINGTTTCASPITRTFTVSESFSIAAVSLGFTAEHARRDDLQVELTLPAGTTVRVLYDDGLSGTQFRHYDVLLNDAAPIALADAKGDHDPAEPYFDRFVRPYAPLRAFQGQNSQGDWTLSICDLNPGADDGAYLRSQLTLTPRDTTAKAGRWSYRMPDVGQLDHVTRTVTIYAEDVVGNRTADPLTLEFVVDNVSPAITVTAAISEVLLGSRTTVLSGTVSDGGPTTDVALQVQDPGGQVTVQGAARDAEAWWHDLQPTLAGRYTLWVVATDQAGNSTTSGPFVVDAACTAADLSVAFVSAEPAASAPFSVTITALISNTGRAEASAGLPVGFYIGEERLGVAVTAQALGPGVAQAVSLTWAVPFPGDYDITVVPNDAGTIGQAAASGAGTQVLCSQPASGRQMASVLDVPLLESWNLMSAYVNPFNPNASVVQRPIAGQYVVIQGFDGGAQSYYPDLPPEVNTLKEMDAEHGYWIKAVGTGQLSDGDEDGEEAVATLRVVGEKFAEDRPIELDVGWNLVSYLPRQPQAVPEALQSIDGQYTVVLGYDQGALSYYPDIDPSFNTLHEMEPLFGYWIKMAQAGTLQYPTTGDFRFSIADLRLKDNLIENRKSEIVNPTTAWVNFYGTAHQGDGTPLPVGATVLALDPDGVVCGATMVTTEGQYGLLACYGDDPTTLEDEGAWPGDTIQLVVDGQVLGMGMWTARGDRQWRPLGKVDLWQLYLPLVRKGSR